MLGKVFKVQKERTTGKMKEVLKGRTSEGFVGSGMVAARWSVFGEKIYPSSRLAHGQQKCEPVPNANVLDAEIGGSEIAIGS